MAAERVLVPVSPSSTLRETVEYAVNSTLDAADAAGGVESPGEGADGAHPEPDAPAPDVPVIYFVYVHAPEEFDPEDHAPALDDADELLQRVRVWAEDDAGDDGRLEVRTRHVGGDRYLFSPADVAAALTDVARARGVSRIVLDPEYDPGVGAPLLQPIAYELSRDESLSIEEAPVRQAVRRRPLVGGSSARRVGALVGLSFVFYQILAGTISAFDLVTGTVTAVIVAGSLSRVTFSRDPSLRETPARLARAAIYVPYLFWEILVANLAVAALILDPRQSVDPRMTRIRPAVYGALPITSLANSITLTPGTLTVRVQGRELLVHTLMPAARKDLFDGALERAIRFVFYGRAAMRIESLTDRDAAAMVPPGGDPAADAGPPEAGTGEDGAAGGESS